MSVSTSPPMFLQFFVPGTNQPAVGYQLFTYIAGTSTKQATWTDSTQTVQNTNPVVADANGVMIVWLDPTLTYKFVLASRTDTDPPSSPIYSVDNISPTISAATLTQALIGSILYPRTTAEIVANVTPTNYEYRPFDPRRYGLIGDGSHPTQDASAWASWKLVMGNSSTVGSQQDDINWSRVEPTAMGIGPSCLIRLSLGAIENTAYGNSAGANITSGQANLAMGYSALPVATTGSFMTSVGVNSMLLYTTGLGFVTAVGYGSYARGIDGNNIVCMGFEAHHDNGHGTSNVAIGTAALHSGTNAVSSPAPADPSSCTAVGDHAAEFNYGSNNVAVGASSLLGPNTYSSGANNVAVGTQSLTALTTASNNVAVGHQAGLSLTTAPSNILIGYQAGENLATGTGLNVYIGSSAGFWNTTATQSVAVGANALVGTNGSNGGGANTAIGNGSMQLCGVAGNCTAVGNLSLRNVSTGNNIVAVGDSALINETTGTNLTSVGNASGAQTAGFTNSANFGYQASATGSNQITLGNSSITTLRCQVTTITALSDERFKTDIKPLEIPDGLLDEVQIVTYKWIADGMPAGKQVGVIAQQLDLIQRKYDAEWLGLVDKSNPERWEATPGKLLFLLIPRVQSQQNQIDALSIRIEALEHV